MKAIYLEKFGSEDVLTIGDIAAPAVGPGEVRIRVAYAAVNPVDWKIREGRLASSFPHVFPIVPGWDVAGLVESVGTGVTRVSTGDRVYAYARRPEVQFGTYAELTVVREDAVAIVPERVSLRDAAAVPLAALTAEQSLMERAKVRSGETVLVLGGAGGVGNYAVQIAKNAGARVIATASEPKHAYVKRLGADEAVDYAREDVAEAVKRLAPGGVDVVLDTVGTIEDAWASVRHDGAGRVVSIIATPDAARAKELLVDAGFVFVRPDGAALDRIAASLDRGEIVVPIIEELGMHEAKRAHEASRGGRTTGKIVLRYDLS